MAEYVFRHAGGCLIEGPTLSPPSQSVGSTPGYRWVATVWPDPCQPDGWDHLSWDGGERGWLLPYTLAVGDIIEWGITWADHQRGIDGPTVRWYGWLEHATDRALIVHGPYEHPSNAMRDANRVVDELRLDQLDAPAFRLPGNDNTRTAP
jgi:hypothetical protein